MNPLDRLSRLFLWSALVGVCVIVASLVLGVVLHDANGLGTAIGGVLLGSFIVVTGLGIRRQARRISKRITQQQNVRKESGGELR